MQRSDTFKLKNITEYNIASMFGVKQLVESGFCSKSLPSKYVFSRNDDYDSVVGIQDELAKAIPTIDFSLLTSGNPDQRSKVVNDLGNACRDWGFFMVYNNTYMIPLRVFYFLLLLDVSRSFSLFIQKKM